MTQCLRRGRWGVILLVSTLVFIARYAEVRAAGLPSFGEVEKPRPEFVRNGDRLTARLVPRAKSTAVDIEFQVTSGGRLDDVQGMDFDAVDRPEVDVKNFKSAVFEIGIDNVARGGTATLAIRSDFFSLSTTFYAFNPRRASPWIKDTQRENRTLQQRMRELVIPIQDGGDLDADGLVNGRITVIGGPRDSFWGYALGTLFIRFFGIFIVLSILMTGMIVSGWVFRALDRYTGSKPVAADSVSTLQTASQPVVQTPGVAVETSVRLSEEAVAAIGAALYLRERASRLAEPAARTAESEGYWAAEGRKRIMNDRLTVFSVVKRTRV